MATHSGILARRIPWTEEPGGLQSMGSQSWTQLSDYIFAFLPAAFGDFTQQRKTDGICWVMFRCRLLSRPPPHSCRTSTTSAEKDDGSCLPAPLGESGGPPRECTELARKTGNCLQDRADPVAFLSMNIVNYTCFHFHSWGYHFFYFFFYSFAWKITVSGD